MTTETARVEAFSDGVFAIAITLLILEIKVPSPGSGELPAQLLRQWPSYLSFVISFAFIGRLDRAGAVNSPACKAGLPKTDPLQEYPSSKHYYYPTKWGLT